MNKFTWESPPCQVRSADTRIKEETKEPYAVIKVRVAPMNYPNRKEERAFKGKVTTLMCFKEALLPVFRVDDVLIFEGEISFTWGNMFLNITKVWREDGKRLLKAGDEDPGYKTDDVCHHCPHENECPRLEPKEGCKNRYGEAEERVDDSFTKESMVNDNLIPW